jgi:hypothetical protein
MKTNKLLLGTALATSLVAFNTASFADAKVTGSVEMTYNSTEATDADTDGDIGSENTVKFAGSKDIDLGTLTSSFKLEDAGIEAPSITLNMGDTTVGVGADFAPNLSFTNVPTVGDRASTVGKNIATTDLVGSAHNLTAVTDSGNTIKNGNGILLAQKFDGGQISAFIVPSMGSTQGGGTDSGISAATTTGSAYNVVFSGNLGIDGLSIKAGMNDQTGKNGNEDGDAKAIGATYSFGQFSVGANTASVKSVATAGNQYDLDTDSFGIGFAVNDNISIAASVQKTDGVSNGSAMASDEETQLISIGYSLGGLGLEFSFAELENINGVAASDGEAFQIRTVGKF